MTTEVKESNSILIDSLRQQTFAAGAGQRQAALHLLLQSGLPGPKHEEYRFTPAVRLLEKNFNWNEPAAPSQIASIDPFLIPGLDAHVIVMLNGQFSKTLSRIDPAVEGLQILSLAEAFGLDHPLISKYLNQVLLPESDAFAAMNTAFWQDGIVIHVAESVNVEKPVYILHVHDTGLGEARNLTRVLAVLEKGSSLSVIEKSDSAGTQPVFHNFSEEWVVNEGAHLEYCKVQQDPGKVYQISNTVIQQNSKSVLNTFTLTLDGALIRNNLTIRIDGQQCESHFYGLYLLKGNTHADNHTVVDHRQPNSISNELYKGILDDQSKGVFNGKIFVRPHAQKTNAFQSNRNILVSDSAIVHTKPQLEIWADDVKCSHGCTSGQLDDEAMFYLRSRGISGPTAKAMLLYAFASEVLAPIPNHALRTYLDGLIAERLHKNF
jgi:Fe-S cluster assembly protein SufD